MSDPVLRIGGRALHEWLSADLPVLVKTVLGELVARIPAYQQLPAEELSGDISRVIRQNLRSFITILRSRALPAEADLRILRESAARRADEGMPIDVVLTAYHLGVQVIWQSITPQVRDADVTDLMEINALIMRYLELVTPTVAAGYLEQRQTIFGDEHSARQTILAALLQGTPAEDAAVQAGVRLPPGYLVLSVAVGPHPDESKPDLDAGVIARRKLRRVRAELARRTREPVLSSLAAEGGTVLVPVPTPPEELSADDWARVGTLVTSLTAAAGADVLAGAAAATPPGVARAARTAREVLEVAATKGHTRGVYRLEDVLLEYQLSRPGPARERLAGMLEPIGDQDDLLDTLTAYLRLGGRRKVAAELHVHPNTVDYRIRRIHHLTGLDATRPADVSTLEAALVARRALRPPGQGRSDTSTVSRP
ncbi:MAG: transcriptional regulator [Actinophytocola sp.]|nr:transcriptional regulator [Actinophytocola sp.]